MMWQQIYPRPNKQKSSMPHFSKPFHHNSFQNSLHERYYFLPSCLSDSTVVLTPNNKDLIRRQTSLLFFYCYICIISTPNNIITPWIMYIDLFLHLYHQFDRVLS
jgi:hypothetical protein